MSRQRVLVGNVGGPFEVVAGDPPPVGTCRKCGQPTWHSDAVGPVHDCCAIYGPNCPACRASLGLHKARSGR